jgi:hypothetical protein
VLLILIVFEHFEEVGFRNNQSFKRLFFPDGFGGNGLKGLPVRKLYDAPGSVLVYYSRSDLGCNVLIRQGHLIKEAIISWRSYAQMASKPPLCRFTQYVRTRMPEHSLA